MRKFFVALVLLHLAAVPSFSSAARAQSPRDFDICWKEQRSSSLAAIVDACTSVLGSERITAENRAVTHFMRGVAWSDHGELDRALEDFDEAIRLSPQAGLAFEQRGLLWHRKGDLDRAAADYGVAIEKDAEDAIALYGRALIAKRRGNRDGWMADAIKALAIDPDIEKLFASYGVE